MSSISSGSRRPGLLTPVGRGSRFESVVQYKPRARRASGISSPSTSLDAESNGSKAASMPLLSSNEIRGKQTAAIGEANQYEVRSPSSEVSCVMRADELDHDELLELDPEGGVIRFAGQRALLIDAVAMGPLRKYLPVVENFGLTAASHRAHAIRLRPRLAHGRSAEVRIQMGQRRGLAPRRHAHSQPRGPVPCRVRQHGSHLGGRLDAGRVLRGGAAPGCCTSAAPTAPRAGPSVA